MPETQSKHTPGPWVYNHDYVYGSAGEIVCELWGEESDENASLIAAAPDLLAVLKKYTENTRLVERDEIYHEAVAIIAKAEGSLATDGPPTNTD